VRVSECVSVRQVIEKRKKERGERERLKFKS